MVTFGSATRFFGVFLVRNLRYTAFKGTLRLPTPPMETPDPPSDTPGASKQVVLTPHDIPKILRVGFFLVNKEFLNFKSGSMAFVCWWDFSLMTTLNFVEDFVLEMKVLQ